RLDDVLIHQIVSDRTVDVAEVPGDFHGALELARLCRHEKFLDSHNRMLVRHGKSPPAVRAANVASCRGKATKGRGLNKVSGRDHSRRVRPPFTSPRRGPLRRADFSTQLTESGGAGPASLE